MHGTTGQVGNATSGSFLCAAALYFGSEQRVPIILCILCRKILCMFSGQGQYSYVARMHEITTDKVYVTRALLAKSITDVNRNSNSKRASLNGYYY